MIRRLRISFIAVTVLLVTMVLVAVLGLSLASTTKGLFAAVDSALASSANEASSVRPWVGGSSSSVPMISSSFFGWGVNESLANVNIPVFTVTVDSTGAVISTNAEMVSISARDLDTVIKQVSASSEDSGTIDELKLRWRATRDGTTTRIAVADTSFIDSTVSRQVGDDIIIVLGAVTVVFLLAFFFSKLAVKPIADSFESQRRFIADASHELKTPLAVIIANTDILLEHADRIPDEDVKWLESSALEAERMSGLVGEMLELARADERTSGSAPAAEMEQVDLSSLVDLSVLEFDAVAYERGCAIVAEVEPQIEISANKEQISRLVHILVENATKYALVGSEVRVVLTSHDAGGAELRVNNRGNVVSAEDLPHLFDRFYRPDNSRARTSGSEAGGYGLGLAIAKGIVDEHGGKIFVASSEEEGTTFTVLFK